MNVILLELNLMFNNYIWQLFYQSIFKFNILNEGFVLAFFKFSSEGMFDFISHVEFQFAFIYDDENFSKNMRTCSTSSFSDKKFYWKYRRWNSASCNENWSILIRLFLCQSLCSGKKKCKIILVLEKLNKFWIENCFF